MNWPPALEFSSTPTVPAKNDGLLADIASVLVRLDGYLAHVRSAEGASIGKNAGDSPVLASIAAFGGDMFGNLYTDPVRLEGFLRAMTRLTTPVADALGAFPWERVSSVVEIGSAQGCLPVRLALAHPHLTASGFDLPDVGPIFSRYVAAHDLSERVRFIPGDFFQDSLPPADVHIMGMILHDWDLPAKRMLLGKAYASLPQGGSLIVCEMLIDDERRVHLPGLLMSLNMLIETRGGFDFSGADCIGWMRDAGFWAARVVPLSGAYSAVIGTK